MSPLSSSISIISFVDAPSGILTVTISSPRFIARASLRHEIASSDRRNEIVSITSINAVSTTVSEPENLPLFFTAVVPFATDCFTAFLTG